MKTFTIRSKEPVIVMPIKEYESIMETIEILKDKQIMKQIKETESQRKRRGKSVSFEKIKKKAGF